MAHKRIRMTESGLNALIMDLVNETRQGKVLRESRDREVDQFLNEAIGQACIEIMDEALGSEYQTPLERTRDKQAEHSQIEWLRGKIDDIRHIFASTFGNELKDSYIEAALRYSLSSENEDEFNRIMKSNAGRGLSRRKYGYYRNADEVRPDTPEEIQKNASNKIEMIKREVASVFNLKGSYRTMENEFAKYEQYANSGNQKPNLRIALGGRRGFHGGIFYYYCTNSKGQPFFYPDNNSQDRKTIANYCSNDELYPYFPHNREEFERMKQQYSE